MSFPSFRDTLLHFNYYRSVMILDLLGSSAIFNLVPRSFPIPIPKPKKMRWNEAALFSDYLRKKELEKEACLLNFKTPDFFFILF